MQNIKSVSTHKNVINGLSDLWSSDSVALNAPPSWYVYWHLIGKILWGVYFYWLIAYAFVNFVYRQIMCSELMRLILPFICIWNEVNCNKETKFYLLCYMIFFNNILGNNSNIFLNHSQHTKCYFCFSYDHIKRIQLYLLYLSY